MKVNEAMAKTISTASPTDSIKTVAQLMKKEDAGFIPVVDGDSLLGVITDRDIVLRCLAEGHGDILIESLEHCMTINVTTVEANAELEEAAKLMDNLEIRRLAVVDKGKLVGVLSHGNLVQALNSEGAADRATLGVTEGA